MWESDFSKITLLDVVDISEVPIRVSNSIRLAFDDNLWMIYAIRTLEDYLAAGDKAKQRLLQLPNMGLKSAMELDTIIHEIYEAGGIEKPSLATPSLGDEADQADIESLSISDLVNENVTSTRLCNGIKLAVSRGILPFKTVGDYVKAGNSAIGIMTSLPNIGKKTAYELDDLVKDVVNGSLLVAAHVDSEEDHVDNDDIMERLLDIFKKHLTDREYNVLKYRAIKEETLEQVGEIFDVTRERIRQIEKKAKNKLLKYHEKIFNFVAEEICNLLEKEYGEVKVSDAAEAMRLEEEILKLLVYVCGDKYSKPFSIKKEYLFFTKNTENHSEWNDVIDDVLYALKWPIHISQVYERIQDIPHAYIDRYLTIRRGAYINDGCIQELKKIPQKVRMLYVFRDAGHELHSSEIARIYNKLFGENIEEHNAQSIVGRMEEALIVDRGVYSLYEFINLSETTIYDIRRRCYEYIKNEKRYISSKVLYDDLFKDNIKYEGVDSAYVIHGILQDDERFIIRRGLMVGINDDEGIIEHVPLTTEVCNIVEDKGPLSVAEIKKVMADRRNVLSVSISKIVESSNKIIKVAPGIYDAISRVFGDDSVYEDCRIAVKIILSDHDKSLFEIVKNLRAISKINSLSINKSMVASLLALMPEVTKNGHLYTLDEENEILEYASIIKGNINNATKDELIDLAGRKVGVGVAKRYIALDYRMYSQEEKKGEGAAGKNSEINSILSAFGV